MKKVLDSFIRFRENPSNSAIGRCQVKTAAFVIVLSCCAIASTDISMAAENPFVGTWKVNPAKSTETGRTVEYKKTATGYHRSSSQGQDIDFAVDGKEYQEADGYADIWTKTGEREWKTIEKVNGRAFSTIHHKISADGQTMTDTIITTLNDGKTTTDKLVRKRISGGDELEGAWKTVKLDVKPEITIISEPSPGHLRLETPSRQEVIEGPTDGSYFAMTAPDVSEGWVATFKQTDPQTLEWSGGFKDKPEVKGIAKLAADAKSYKNVYWMVGKESEKFTEVLDRQ